MESGTGAGAAGWVRRALGLARRVPLTVSLTVLVLAMGVATGALWDPLASRPLIEVFGYGLPSFEQGRPWTVLTGFPIALEPAQYVVIVLGLVAVGGFAEWRLGSRRTVVALLVCHLTGVLLTVGTLALVNGHGFLFADDLATQIDAGPSAAFLGAGAAATATLRPPMRGRLRVALGVYGLLSFVHIGSLADLEHAYAIAGGLLLGPLLLGRRPRLTVRSLTRRDYRLLAATFFIIAAVEGLYLAVAPVSGPLASTWSPELRTEQLGSASDIPVAVIVGVLWCWLARSLYQGRRWAWWWAVVLLALAMLGQVAEGVMLAVENQSGWPAVAYELAGNSLGMAVLIAGRRAFRNPTKRRSRKRHGNLLAPADEQQRHDAVALLRRVGANNNMSWMTTWPENRWFFAEEPLGYVAYRVHAGVALALCDPVASSAADRARLFASFADRATAAGLVPSFFSVTEEAAATAVAGGWRTLRVAEEAVIDLPTLTFKGKAWQDVRTALNQAAKQGITWRVGPLAEQPRGIQLQVQAISAEWVEDKDLPEMGFTLGGVDEAMDPAVLVGLAMDAEGTVNGITSWMPIFAPGQEQPVGWTLDVMRRLPGGFRYSMEFLIASACISFRDSGCRIVSLSGAPLARADPGTGHGEPHPLDGFLQQLAATLEPHYGFQSLHAFKTKFQPRFAPLHLLFPDEAALPRIAVALSRAYLPQAGLRDLVTLTRSDA